MSILISLLVGFIAGLLASVIVRGRGFGCIGNVVLGLIGGFLGGIIFEYSGYEFNGFWGNVFVSFIGALILLVIVKIVKSI